MGPCGEEVNRESNTLEPRGSLYGYLSMWTSPSESAMRENEDKLKLLIPVHS